MRGCRTQQDAGQTRQPCCKEESPFRQHLQFQQHECSGTGRPARLHRSWRRIQIYIRTNPHGERDPQYQQRILMPLSEPADDTRLFCHAALHGLHRIYRSGYAYQKAGVMLTHIIPAADRPNTLFDDDAARQKSHALMTTRDRINRKMGSGTLRLLGEGTDTRGAMRRENVSRHYTTEWDELAVCRC